MLEALYLLPHGGVMVPGMEPDYNEKSDVLHQAMEKIREDMKKRQIDLVFLNGPHGYVHPVDYLVYYHQVFQGFQIYRGQGYDQPTAKQFVFPGNLQVSQVFIQMLREAGIPASPLIHAETNYPMQLAWGETIPLSYFADDSGPEVVIFSNPMAIGITRGDEENAVHDELFEVSKIIDTLTNSPMLKDRKVALVISGDLSHKHDKEHEYGYHESAEEFDNLATEWCKNPTLEKMNTLVSLQENAASCGIYGMLILHGLINTSDDDWKSDAVVYECPTYFGMAVANWSK